jgi:hypothetical protein
MPDTYLPAGTISFFDIASGTCTSTSNITMADCARRSGVDDSDSQMSISEFREKQVLIEYEAINFDENLDYDISYIDPYCDFNNFGVFPGGSFQFTAIRATVTGTGNGTINVLSP